MQLYHKLDLRKYTQQLNYVLHVNLFFTWNKIIKLLDYIKKYIICTLRTELVHDFFLIHILYHQNSLNICVTLHTMRLIKPVIFFFYLTKRHARHLWLKSVWPSCKCLRKGAAGSSVFNGEVRVLFVCVTVLIFTHT